MSRKSRTTVSAVEKLLEQRRLIQDWLAKLDSNTGDAMPPPVVQRVRNDYRARLAEVMAELTEHADSIRQGLAESQSRHEGLEAQQKQRREELAEARLRKQVGEYDDARFKEISTRLKSTLDELSKELGAAFRDMERYEEILDLIDEQRAPDEAAEAPAPSPLPPQAPPAASEPEPPARPAESPAAAAPPAKQVDALDELAFLRTVTAGAEKKRSTRMEERAEAAATRAPPDVEPPSAPTPVAAGEAEPEAAERTDGSKAEAEPAVAESRESGPVAAPVEAAGSRPRASSERRRSEEARTAAAEGRALMCSECGAPNLPTEWYCEKCGAELQPY
jgi:hypothetical protein